MRPVLDLLYRGCAVLAALSIVAIAVLILAQSIGRLFGILVPSANELAGFCMAAATFLALAPTFRAGGHIRVSLLLAQVPAVWQRVLEVWCLLFAAAVSGYFTWYAADLALTSWRFGDVSPGLVPVPLWIPQAGMAFGLGVLVVAVLDGLAEVLAGRRPGHAGAGDGGL
jgi:TRAP-type C4-dicarboxylate transport system permease small subunit